ncbi:PLP-dependent lyase/thiolase [Bacteroidota bacterium]
MKKEILLKSGWIKIEKNELDSLREKIREHYELDGGSKKFNSHLDNYEELREIIKEKIREFKEKEDIEIKINDQVEYDILPGNTFFRNLLYTNRNEESLRFQEYNIEICYLFTHGKKRFDYLRQEKKIMGEEKWEKKNGKNNYKLIVSSTMNNMIEADKIIIKLKDEMGFIVESETRDTHTYSKGTLNNLYNNLDESTLVISLISRNYLQNESCVKELIDYTNSNLDNYLAHTFHVLLDDIYEGDFNIFDSLGRSELLKYWKLRSEKLEENHKFILGNKKDKEIFLKLSKELKEIKEIIVELNRVLDLIRVSDNRILFKILLSKIKTPGDFIKLLPRKTSVKKINVELENTYKGIKIPSMNNPKKPEFPPLPYYKPKYPASETYRINIPGFSNVWLKDESTNPTGTHKDRLAWEVVIKYKSLIKGLKYKDYLPQMSIISSGSAAIAIQHFLNLFEIPVKLKVLVDNSLNESIATMIKEIGCELYQTDLSKKMLSSDEIKELTDNLNGIDITYRETLDPNQDNYYDWMSYEILKENPDFCFIPFGTGDLFINVLNIVKAEYFNSYIPKHDPRFFGDMETLRNCHFLGASSDQPNTVMDKLYSSFLPSIDSFKKYIDILKNEYSCIGRRTGFYYVKENFVQTALEIASNQNLRFEPSGMGGLALLLQMKDTIPKDAKILIVNTGKTKELKELTKIMKK